LPPMAVQGTKRSLNLITKSRAAEVFEASIGYEVDSIKSEDFAEAISAFLEKRKPVYHNR